MAEYHINLFYSDEDGGWIADIPDLALCSAFGETQDALREAMIAKEAWLEAARQLGRPIPEPRYRRRSIRPPEPGALSPPAKVTPS
ncbi:MAG: type II toxin-antitoxin system HicB family antitoxin [Rhodospirillales bacterium]